MTSRRAMLTLTVGAGFAALQPAQADPAPLDKAAVGYQDVPSQGHVCAQCVYFIAQPPSGNLPSGRCKLVAGRISPSGWCEIWTPKS